MRILIVDREPVFRLGVRALVERQPDLEIVGEANAARAAFGLLDRRPDVVLLDLVLSGLDGISTVRELRQRTEGARVLVVTAAGRACDVREALAAGATGYLLKTDPPERLLDAIRAVGRGQRALSPGLEPFADLAADGAEPGDLLGVLSRREREVFALIVQGLSTKRIARELCISTKTVDTHRQRIYEKLGCHSAADVVRFAAMNDLLRGRPFPAPSRGGPELPDGRPAI
jgi:DNA-binding NarL/FixJ family response regulator